MSLAEFLEHASAQGIPVVDYAPAELAEELAYLEPERIRDETRRYFKFI
jgi:hypothetical protein